MQYTLLGAKSKIDPHPIIPPSNGEFGEPKGKESPPPPPMTKSDDGKGKISFSESVRYGIASVVVVGKKRELPRYSRVRQFNFRKKAKHVRNFGGW